MDFAKHPNVSRGTGLAPNEVHIGRYIRLPMTILEGRGVKGHQNLKKDQLEYLDLVRDRQIRAYNLVREEDKLLKARHDKANDKLAAKFSKIIKIKTGDWIWLYNDASAVTGGGKRVLKIPTKEVGATKSFALIAKLAYCWTGPYKVLLADPGETPQREKVGPKLLLIDVRRDEPGKEINPRVSVLRVKKCFNPHYGERKPRFLHWAMSNYVMNKYSELAPPFHLT